MSLITTRGRYATRIMVHLATRTGGRPARKQEIAAAEGLSANYVEQLLAKLKAAGLVRSIRGVAGGYLLARDPASVSVHEVLLAAEGPLDVAPCRSAPCARASVCVTQGVWQEATQALIRVFASHTIATLAAAARQVRESGAATYEI